MKKFDVFNGEWFRGITSAERRKIWEDLLREARGDHEMADITRVRRGNQGDREFVDIMRARAKAKNLLAVFLRWLENRFLEEKDAREVAALEASERKRKRRRK